MNTQYLSGLLLCEEDASHEKMLRFSSPSRTFSTSDEYASAA